MKQEEEKREKKQKGERGGGEEERLSTIVCNGAIMHYSGINVCVCVCA